MSRLRDEMTPISLVRGQLGDQRVKGTLYQEKKEEALKVPLVSTTARSECPSVPQLNVGLSLD